MTDLGDKEKAEAYNYLWSLSDAEMEELFPTLDGFWSSTTQSVIRKFDPTLSIKKKMCSSWTWLDRHWTCPICRREKADIIKRGKSGKLVFDVVVHHDHVCDLFQVSPNVTRRGLFVRRFSSILICAECNIADANAKGALMLPSWFTFSPLEISHFISAKSNQSHNVNLKLAKKLFEESVGSMQERIEQARAIEDGLIGYYADGISRPDAHELFERVAEKAQLPAHRIYWAFETRSRTHKYTELHPPTLSSGQCSPF